MRGVSFDLCAGEVHALIGENGAGKSTLIRVVTGAHAPDSGTMFVGGIPVTGLTPVTARSLGIACIHQQPALFRDLTVAENIGLRLEPAVAWRRVNVRAQRDRARELLARIGAAIDPGTEAGELSMPDQQLVEIACTVGAGARIVVMDEPTASLGPVEQRLLSGVIRELRAGGAGIVYITHRLNEIFALADRVTVLRDGESVGTHRMAGAGDSLAMDESGLIRLMVGRDVADLYPPSLTAPGETVLRLRGVGCSSSRVHDVSLEVRAGEILGLAGLVGAGRSELARILFGLTPADAGVIELAGRAVRIGSPPDAVALGIGYVPEDRRRHGVIPELSLAANVTLAVRGRLFPGGWLRPSVEDELAGASIREFAVKAPGPAVSVGTLSGGNQQKIALARWLATRPCVLILDEPTQGVDVGAKAEIHRIIRGLAAQGLAVVMISSDLPEVLGLADRIAVMRGGTIVGVYPAGNTAERIMAAAMGLSGLEAVA